MAAANSIVLVSAPLSAPESGVADVGVSMPIMGVPRGRASGRLGVGIAAVAACSRGAGIDVGREAGSVKERRIEHVRGSSPWLWGQL